MDAAEALGARRWLWRTAWGARRATRGLYGVTGPHGRPAPRPGCAVLRTRAEADAATAEVRALGLPPHNTREKHWDGLVALDQILRHTGPRARIVDAGGEYYSRILPWLSLYGYTDLTAGNLSFTGPDRRGAVRFEPMDLTRTPFAAGSVDAVTCLSVIEHGVDRDAYFGEMRRILRPGGLLVTSTDYWHVPIDTGGQSAYGTPIRVFTPDDIRAWLAAADQHGFELNGPLDLATGEPVVHWAEFDLRFTFVVFTHRRRA